MFGTPIKSAKPVKELTEDIVLNSKITTSVLAVVKQESPTLNAPTKSAGAVSGVSVENKTYSVKISDKLLVSPKTTVNWLFFLMLSVALLALILNILIEIKIQHPDLIANGIFLVCMITSAIVVNHFLSVLRGAVTSS